MRIVHLVNYFTLGLGYQEEFLARLHAEFGHEVHVITSARAYARQRNYAPMGEVFPERTLATGVDYLGGCTIHRLSPYGELNTQVLVRGVPSLIDRLSPDLVIAHGAARLETVRLLLVRGRRPTTYRLLVDDHSLFSGYAPTAYRAAYYSFFRRFVRNRLHLVDRFIPVTAETARFLHDLLGIPRDRMTVVPIGADTETFRFDDTVRRRTRAQLGYSSSAFVILCVGKITRQKGTHLAYDAARDLLRESQDTRLLLVGSGADGDLSREIAARASNDGVASQVTLRAHVPHGDLVGFYCAADVGFFPNPTMAALEAASCGRPLVLSAQEASRERTANGNGFVYSTIPEASAALRRLSADCQLRADMGHAGAEFVRAQFSWRTIAQRFLDVGEQPDGPAMVGAPPT